MVGNIFMSSQSISDNSLGGSSKLPSDHPDYINNCDKEPIHIPGSIQPHGYLIGFSAQDNVLYASSNLEEITAKPAESCLGQPLHQVLGQEEAALVISKTAGLNSKKYFKQRVNLPDGSVKLFDGLLHKSEDVYVLELEKVLVKESEVDLEFFNESLRQLEEASSPQMLAQMAARKVQELTGFGRVMVYHFKEDGSGEVVAEEKQEAMKPFLGLHYPATDIPKQARQLYLLNPIRNIPNVEYTPVVIECRNPELDPAAPKPLDLSFANLRSVSPVHVQYLKNMEVGASMSVSIIRNGRLWGLIACHHPTPHYVPHQNRQLCELLGRVFGVVLGEKEEATQRQYKQIIQEVKNQLFQGISKAERYTEGLYKKSPTVKELVQCGGCVISFGEEYISLGETPSEEQVGVLTSWLQKNNNEDVFATHELPVIFPPAEKFRATGSGILAITISRVQREYIIWFRPELEKIVTWAGKQEKSLNEAGELQLTPRNSFKEWTELVRNTSEPWIGLELEAAKELRGLIVDIVLRMSGQLKLRADILTRLNKEVNSSKSEMDSFAYIASHDLKEPLRGIHAYATFVLEDYAAVLDQEGQAKLKTLIRLSDRSQQLVDSLLQFSRLGRMELDLEEVDLKVVLEEVSDVFSLRFLEENVHLEVQDGEWPVVKCDRLRISEVFINLVSNAYKYNNKEVKHIKVGFRRAVKAEESPSGYVFFVQDNGIGIDPKFHHEVFTIFRRLNARNAYGGGTGAGLTITKKIVERHGGKIWLNSQLGKGSCFNFTF